MGQAYKIKHRKLLYKIKTKTYDCLRLSSDSLTIGEKRSLKILERFFKERVKQVTSQFDGVDAVK